MYEFTDNLLAQPQREVYSVAQLNRDARELLEQNFPLIWVTGELSNLARPSSGHLYFSLKDSQAQVRCVMFRLRNMHLGFAPDNGMQVLMRARVSLYEGRGEFQLIAEHMEEAGDGALRRAFEILKQRLANAGLFDESRKKSLPVLPRRVGVVTSPTGAAIRDILSTLRRRFPLIEVLIYPVPVQGAGAADKIARAIRLAAERAECEVVIIARGGGSLEDLWAFNEEVVAHAIADCPIPVVTGIGHEIDFTIADLAADRRAATPTAAAELVCPDQGEWEETLAGLSRRLVFLTRSRLELKTQSLTWLEKRLQHPGQRLRNHAQRLDELEQRLRHAQRSVQRHAHSQLAELAARVRFRTPLHRLTQLQVRQENSLRRLRVGLTCLLDKHHAQLSSAARALDAVSPLATLSRGYAIMRHLPGKELVRTARDVAPGDRIHARLGQGQLLCKVEETHDE